MSIWKPGNPAPGGDHQGPSARDPETQLAASHSAGRTENGAVLQKRLAPIKQQLGDLGILRAAQANAGLAPRQGIAVIATRSPTPPSR
jgi:hypothetical protein